MGSGRYAVREGLSHLVEIEPVLDQARQREPFVVGLDELDRRHEIPLVVIVQAPEGMELTHHPLGVDLQGSLRKGRPHQHQRPPDPQDAQQRRIP